MQHPRKPGSQVAPNQRPHVSGGRTATTHSTVPIHEATAGKRYRVRDKDWERVWGEDLSFEQATKLKETVVGGRRSTTARVEPMDVPPPDWYQRPDALEVGTTSTFPEAPLVALQSEDRLVEVQDEAPASPMSQPGEPAPGTQIPQALGPRFDLAGSQTVTIPCRGVIVRIPPGHELVLNNMVVGYPIEVKLGDVAQARPVDPALVAAAARARAAVQQVVGQRPRYRDVTVKAQQARTTPPPADRTVAKEPVMVRLGANPSPPAPAKAQIPPSPLKVATQQDGDQLPDDALGDEDLHDLAVDIGGIESTGDVEHAQRMHQEKTG